MFYSGGMNDLDELPVDPYPEALEEACWPRGSEAEFERRLAASEAEQINAGEVMLPGITRVSVPVVVGFAIEDAAAAQFAGNRAMAAQLAALAEAVDTARRHPDAYLSVAGMAEPDAPELAERAAALDAGLQLNLSPALVRTRAH